MFPNETKPAYVRKFLVFLLLQFVIVAAFLFFAPINALGESLTLEISKSPNVGAVKSSDGFINCGATCSHTYEDGTNVSLIASTNEGYAFGGWSVSGVTILSGCGAIGGCTVSMTDVGSVTAIFKPILTVEKSPNGGVVTASGINCGADCFESYIIRRNVTLTASAHLGYVFNGWLVVGPRAGAGCSGVGACTVSMTVPGSVTASFKPILTVGKSPDRGGTITASGINCGADCSESYAVNANVTLAVSANPGHIFKRWLVRGSRAGAGCSDATGTCTVSMTVPGSVTASFVDTVNPVDGWAWGLSTDSSIIPVLGTNVIVNARGTLEFLNVIPNAGNPAGPGWIALINTTGTPRFAEPGVTTTSLENYGLTFYLTNDVTGEGYFKGYAWSSSFGWIEFKNDGSWCPADRPPGAPCGATVDSSGKVHGWARILSLPQAGADAANCGNAGGWGLGNCYKGWIRLGSESRDLINYGLQIGIGGSLTGYAWSNEFGWFRFMGQVGRPPEPRASCNLVADPRIVTIEREAGRAPDPATTNVAWACEYTNNDCWLIASTENPPRARVAISDSSMMSLTVTTDYTIFCTSAVTPIGSRVDNSDRVEVKFSDQNIINKIIECNPNSPNCK